MAASDGTKLSDMVPKVEQQVCTTDRQETEQDVTQNYRNDADTLPFDQQYPNYGWNHDGIQRDDELQITSPDGEDPTLYGTVSITSATSPVRQGASRVEEAKVKDKSVQNSPYRPAGGSRAYGGSNNANGPKAG